MNPDLICEEYAEKNVKILVNDLEESTILFEGDSTSLEFIGKLFLSVAKANDCGFEISPLDVGKIFFKSGSTKGLYIHRIPCEHKKK